MVTGLEIIDAINKVWLLVRILSRRDTVIRRRGVKIRAGCFDVQRSRRPTARASSVLGRSGISRSSALKIVRQRRIRVVTGTVPLGRRHHLIWEERGYASENSRLFDNNPMSQEFY